MAYLIQALVVLKMKQHIFKTMTTHAFWNYLDNTLNREVWEVADANGASCRAIYVRARAFYRP
jgi:hypothetical protein